MTEQAAGAPTTPDTVRWSEDDGVVILTLDDPSQSVNTMNAAYLASLEAVLARLEKRVAADAPTVRGVVVTSGKPTFFAGGDLHDLVVSRPKDAAELTAFVTTAKRQLRRLERLDVPVVAAINGSALGGGYEIALACHHRILLDSPKIRVGLPEVTLGLLPGGGGVVRSVRLLGLDRALDLLLLSGRTYAADAALEQGLVDEVVTNLDQLLPAAMSWIAAHPRARQPWDHGIGVPGGTANDPQIEAALPLRAAALRASHRGAPMPAPAAILATAVESTQLDVDGAFDVETRYFVDVATGPVSTNIIQGTFFDLHTVRSGASRPVGHNKRTVERVAVLGAGLMGSGIAVSAALAGLEVLLKDVDIDAALRGRAHAERAVGRLVSSGRLSVDEGEVVLTRIRVTSDVADLSGCDLVVEAVFEDPELKTQVLAEVLDVVAPDALIASNTSTLPITELATGIDRPEDFIGLHFFSPVERMDLVEIVVGEQTTDATLARAFDLVRQLGKTPIVVGDGRGFFSSRVILSRLLEAAAMLDEGIAPSTIEQASLQAGYPTGTLALLDDLTLTLPAKIHSQFREAAQSGFTEHPGAEVLRWMIDAAERPGRTAGAGFYDYADGRRGTLWPGLADRFGPWRHEDVDLTELIDRLLYAEAVDTARCLESGLLRSEADANVGSLLGIGYPRWTGGAAQIVSGHPGGPAGFVARARFLASTHGPRFEPPAALVARAGLTTAVEGVGEMAHA